MESRTTAHLESVWTAAEDEAYAVGTAGTVLKFDGARWTRLDVGVNVYAGPRAGRAANDAAVEARGEPSQAAVGHRQQDVLHARGPCDPRLASTLQDETVATDVQVSADGNRRVRRRVDRVQVLLGSA